MYSLIATFNDLDDPRHHRTRKHELTAVIVIALLGIMSGAESWVEVATFGRTRESWLRGFLSLPNGAPSHDTFGRVFARLDPNALQQRFLSWMGRLLSRIAGQHIAIDGKTVRGSHTGGDRKSAIHLVNAWSCTQGLFFGQLKTADKSNEITAIPELLAALDIRGCLISIDAMGCQVAIAQKIIDGQGHYLLALKGNQPTMLQAAQRAFEQIDAAQDIEQVAVLQPPAPVHDHDQTEAHRHNRDEVRRVWSMSVEDAVRTWDASQQAEAARWPSLSTLVCIESERQELGKPKSIHQRYFLASDTLTAAQAGATARAHWGVENGLHWRLDVLFGEDASRVRTDHAPENFSLLRKVALNAIKADTTKGSVNVKRFKAAMDPDFLLTLLKGVEAPPPFKKRSRRRTRKPRSP